MGRMVAPIVLLFAVTGSAQTSYRDGTPHFWPEGAVPAPGAELVPPRELAGFRFGWSVAEARRACERAGHQWSEGRVSVCSGVARDPGFDAKVRLRFCDDKLCEASAIIRGDTVAAYAPLLRVLERAFGDEEVARLRADPPCRDELRSGRRDQCEQASARHYWSAGGFELFLGLEIPRGHGLKVVFRAPARLQELSATSD